MYFSMKKYLMTAAAAIALCGTFTSCTHDDITTGNGKIDVVENYEQAFLTRFGQPAVNQTWGFGKAEIAGTRSQTNPTVPDINAPYDADWVANYNETAKEPNQQNCYDNYDNGYYSDGEPAKYIITKNASITKEPTMPNYGWNGTAAEIMYNYGSPSDEDRNWYNQTLIPLINAYNAANNSIVYDSNNYPQQYVESKNNVINAFWNIYNALNDTGRTGWINVYTWPDYGEFEPEEGYWTEATGTNWVADETYVTHFKITGTWNGYINVAATEQDYGDPRTIVVSGTWNINDQNQRIGRGGMIVVANGGTINIAEGKALELVNQSRLVVLQGGEITGAGNIMVTNGTAAGMENYNGGTINITGYFNNNFGKFYNYGKLKCTQYQAGGQGQFAAFYNHGVVNINNGGVPGSYTSTNARIFNACQWYCATNMRAYILELAPSSYFYVGGELEMSCGNDGSGDETYVAMAGGAHLQTNTLNNNNTNWYGTSEDAPGIVEIGKVTYLNWTNETAGFFRNNLYVSIDDQTNLVDGNGMQNEICSIKFWNTPGKYLPYQGTEKGKAPVTVPGDEDFVLGESGCAPGYEGSTTRSDVAPVKVIAEDLSVDESGDFDFNDVVFTVDWVSETEAKITLQKAGGTLPLVVGVAAGQEESNGEFHANEVHKRFNVSTGTMVNIGSMGVARDEVSFNVSGTFSMETFEADCNNIRVAVKKNGQWHELTAIRGKVPSKIAVAKRYVPCDERQDIQEKYDKFPDWVENPTVVWY